MQATESKQSDVIDRLNLNKEDLSLETRCLLTVREFRPDLSFLDADDLARQLQGLVEQISNTPR